MSEYDAYLNELLKAKAIPVVVAFFTNYNGETSNIPLTEALDLSNKLADVAFNGRYNGTTVGYLIGRGIRNEHSSLRMMDFVRNVASNNNTPDLDRVIRGEMGYTRLNSNAWCYMAVSLAYKMRSEYRKALPDGNYMKRMSNTLNWLMENCSSGIVLLFADIAFNRFKLPFDFNTSVGARFRSENLYDLVFGISSDSNYEPPAVDITVELPEVDALVIPEKTTTVATSNSDRIASEIMAAMGGDVSEEIGVAA